MIQPKLSLLSLKSSKTNLPGNFPYYYKTKHFIVLRFLFFPILFLSTLLQAQGYDTHKYGPCSQLRFSAMPALYNKLTYVNIGPELFGSSVGVGGEFVISYGQAIWKGFGINVGLGFGVVPHNFYMHRFPDSLNTLPDDGFPISLNSSSRMDYIFTFPILVEKKFRISQEDKVFLNLEAGIKWNFQLNGNYTATGRFGATTEDGIPIDFRYRLINENQAEFISYVFKVGLLKMNRVENSFSWNLVVQHSPSPMFTGIYQFNELGFESFGTMEHHNSYIGMELIYGLSLGRKSNDRVRR
jgi:hypothetical protein